MINACEMLFRYQPIIYTLLKTCEDYFQILFLEKVLLYFILFGRNFA